MQILVKSLSGRTYPLDVDGNNTIKILKKKIQDVEGIHIDSQRLIFAGKQLQDEKTLNDYKIQPFSQLNVLASLGHKSPTIKLIIQSHATQNQVTEEEEEVKTTWASTTKFILYANPKDTIKNLKAKIQNMFGIPVKKQRLSLYSWETSQKELNDEFIIDNVPHNGQNKPHLCLKSSITLDVTTALKSKVELDLTEILPSLINTSKWKFESFTEVKNGVYTMDCPAVMDIATFLEYICLSNSADYPLIIKMRPSNETEMVIKNHYQPIFGLTYIKIKLDINKTKISTDIEWIKQSYEKLEGNIKEPTVRIEKLKRNELFTKIPACKSLQELFNYKRFDDYIFDKVDRYIYKQSHEYAMESVKINNMIVATKKKIEQDQENGKYFTIHINECELKMAELEVRVTLMKQGWLITRKIISDTLTDLIEKKKEELHQTFELWTLKQFVEWLKYFVSFDIKLDDEVMKNLRMLNLNGSKLHEISDSLLIMVGVKNPEIRKLILEAVNDLFDKYGGHKYAKAQLCCICTMNEVNTCLVPCGHMCYCDECGKKSFDHTDKCPICRKDIITLVATYKAGSETS